MRRVTLLLVAMMAITSCTDNYEKVDPAPQKDLTQEDADSRIIGPQPDGRYDYFKKLFGTRLSESQIRDICSGYNAVKLHDMGTGSYSQHDHDIEVCAEDPSLTGLKALIAMEADFTSYMGSFIGTKSQYKYLGMALHLIYDPYNILYQGNACYPIFTKDMGSWFLGTRYASGSFPGYLTYRNSDDAINDLYKKLVLTNNVLRPDIERWFKNWSSEMYRYRLYH